MDISTFSIAGIVVYKSLKWSKNNNPYCFVILKTVVNEKFSTTVPMISFGEVAENIDKAVENGHYVEMTGSIKGNKDISGGNKTTPQLIIEAFGFIEQNDPCFIILKSIENNNSNGGDKKPPVKKQSPKPKNEPKQTPFDEGDDEDGVDEQIPNKAPNAVDDDDDVPF